MIHNNEPSLRASLFGSMQSVGRNEKTQKGGFSLTQKERIVSL